VAKKKTKASPEVIEAVKDEADRPDSIPLDEAEFLTVQNILLKQKLVDQEVRNLEEQRQELYGRIGARSGVKSIADYTIDMKTQSAVLEDKSS